MHKPRVSSSLIPMCLSLLLLSAGCATVSYDQQADQQITSVTQEVNLQLLTWAEQAESGKAVPYDTSFYDKSEADISTLQIRMEASQDPATQKLIDIFKSLTSQIEELRGLHKKQNNLSGPFFRAELQLLSVQLATLTTFELSLKGSQSRTSSSAKTSSTATSITTKQAADSNAHTVVEQVAKPSS